MTRRALIFYISRYSGHYHAASAIEKALLEINKNIEIKKINALDYTNPILGKIINRIYLEVIKKRPELWGHIYDNPEVLQKTRKAREALHWFNMSKIKRLLESFKPDVVLCTQAFPCGMVADYKKSCDNDVPLIGVLTDHAPHSYWLFDEVNFYIVPFDETALGLEKKGIPRDKIKVFGIPVDPRFKKSHNIGQIKKNLGLLEEEPTILMMGGSQGLGVVEEIAKSLLDDVRYKYQLLVVTGSNKRLFKRLKRLIHKKGEDRIRIFSYIQNVDELMEISSLIITKAGGMTVAEALAKNLPMVIVNPIPGHERMNTDFLVEKGAGIEIKDYSSINEKMHELLSSKQTLNRMIEAIKALAKPNSALDTAHLALEI